MNRRLLTQAVAALAAFAVWTLIVSVGISHGSRPSAWISKPFGDWPSKITTVRGSSDIQLSIFATFTSSISGTTSPPGVPPDLFGQAAIGSTVDSNDSGNINGSRFITGLRAGAVASISVFVAGPIDHAPNDKFQLAIYDDAHGAPHHRVAATASGSLVADAWNTLPIDAVLRPQTAYWMMYNSNGSRAEVNNPTFTPVNGNLIDDAVRSHRSPRLHDIADRITAVGDNIPTTVALIVLCALVVRRRRGAAVLLVAGFGAALLIALLLRETVFSPYGLYPSGHALRTTYVAVALAFVVPRRGARVVGALLVAAVALAAVYVGGHHADEVVGGSLLGWAMATAATAFATKPTRAPAPSPVTGAPAPAAATTDRGHEARADETVGV